MDGEFELDWSGSVCVWIRNGDHVGAKLIMRILRLRGGVYYTHSAPRNICSARRAFWVKSRVKSRVRSKSNQITPNQ